MINALKGAFAAFAIVWLYCQFDAPLYTPPQPAAHEQIEDGLLSPEFCRQGSPTRVYLSDMAWKVEQMGGIK